jgi:hypothetical protein
MYHEFLNDSIPWVIDKTLFSTQILDERTDEHIFGIYSIYEMGEFISSSLKSLRLSMIKMIEVISNKVNQIKNNLDKLKYHSKYKFNKAIVNKLKEKFKNSEVISRENFAKYW